MQKFKLIDGINIQWPWSELLLGKKKKVETRSYPLPLRLKGVELAIIETPGLKGKRDAGIVKARIIGTIVFVDSYKYASKKHWVSEADLHLVDFEDKQFAFSVEKEKWAWVVGRVVAFKEPVAVPAKRGIIFAKNCKVPKV